MQHPIQIGSAGGEYMDTVLVLQWAVPLGAAVKAGEVVVRKTSVDGVSP